MNIDIDDLINENSPGEKFREVWLDRIPEQQWPSYIDETAGLVMRGIAIGDTNLTKADYFRETGEYYQQGLVQTTGRNGSETTLPIGQVSASDLGNVMRALNGLKDDIQSSDNANYNSASRAIEAVINKAIIRKAGEERVAVSDFDTLRLPENASVTDLMSEIFCRPRSEEFVDILVDVAEESRQGDSLLQLLEEPQMVTPLWDHQRERLDAWLNRECRGYVDMATATGKTFLGLAAIAHHFGKLHPKDVDLERESSKPATDEASVVVVAHRAVILDQWKREFDRHLNIPEDAAASDGEHTAEYSWGTVRFWTPKRLMEHGVPDTNLVVLDEIHHYLGSSGFGGILDEIDGHLLALSGSMNEQNAKTLERRDIPQIGDPFTIRDGQEVGIIPECDWHVKIVPYEGQSRLAEVTEEYTTGMEKYHDGSAVSELNGDFNAEDLSFDTLSEARSVIQSRVGRKLKEQEDGFRRFSSAVKSRQLTKSNLSPELSAITSLTLEHVHDHKCVVMLETGHEIETVIAGLRRELGDEFEDLIVDIRDVNDVLDSVRTFDEEYDAGAIVGTASTLGEGVDIKTADVGINRSSGQLSNSLVQRIGRVLRNPDGDKLASFYHVMAIPTEQEAVLPREDGTELLETASQLVCWGESFDARPDFEAIGNEVASSLEKLERHGAQFIAESSGDEYTWPARNDVQKQLEVLHDQIRRSGESALLSIEPQLGTGNPKEQSVPYVTGHDSTNVELSDDLWQRILARVGDGEPPEKVGRQFVERAVRNQLRKNEQADRELMTTTTNDGEGQRIDLNPVLAAVLRSELKTTEVRPVEFVQTAVNQELSAKSSA